MRSVHCTPPKNDEPEILHLRKNLPNLGRLVQRPWLPFSCLPQGILVAGPR